MMSRSTSRRSRTGLGAEGKKGGEEEEMVEEIDEMREQIVSDDSGVPSTFAASSLCVLSVEEGGVQRESE